jgi:hypothetical protein
MGHPALENKSLFAFELMVIADEEGRPLIIPVIKAAYDIHSNKGLSRAKDQFNLNMNGEYWGDPEKSSYKYEPETAFIKPATDVVLIGHAHAQKSGDTAVDVGVRVGPVQKVVRVLGDRLILRRSGRSSVYGPKPFEKIPLVYERAFGGWDRSHKNPDKHTFEPRNPVGVGFGFPEGKTEEPLKLPNLEDPKRPWKRWGDRPPPAGFGFISPHWQPRASFAGTYDKKWDETRKPLLPTDFDRRFFNAASPGLIAPGYLQGNESVVVVNASPYGRLAFDLPGVPPPWCAVELRGGKLEVLQTQLDTVIINTDENLVFLLWRSHMVVRNGPQDVLAIEIDTKPRPADTAAA